MKKILIAVDFTPAAQKVAETGYAVAKAMQAEVALVHVIADAAWYAAEYSPIMGYVGGYTAGTVALVDDIKKEAENFLTASVKHLDDNNITTAVLEGEIIDALLKYSTDWNADLIVLGSHSHHGLDRIFGTDTAHYILKHSKIPLLTIPTDDK